MAGKSTLMRQAALAVILAQMGSFVPARRARIGLVDRVLTRVGASDNLSRGESTFMVEMKETANVLRRATQRSLVVLDEIGRGTSTYDGLAIAWAVAEHLHDVVGVPRDVRDALPRAHRARGDAHADLRELERQRARARRATSSSCTSSSAGAASRSYGVACARLAGLPEPVLARAKAHPRRARARGRAAERRPVVAPRALPLVARQLELFDEGAAPRPEPNPALELLRAVDVDRLTPLEALQLVARLKGMATDP